MEFWIKVEEEMYYPSTENKGADQLCSYCTADLRLCFRIGKDTISHDAAHLNQDSVSKLSQLLSGTKNVASGLYGIIPYLKQKYEITCTNKLSLK